MNSELIKSNIPGIDAIFVVTVKTFTDRITHIENELKKAAIEFAFIYDFDVPDITEALNHQFFPKNSHLSMGARSLVLKNKFIWEVCVKHNLERILVLEDDAVLHKQFKSQLQTVIEVSKTIKEGYYIFLGGAQSKIPDYFHLSNGPIIPLRGDTTEGYLIDRKGCELLLNWTDNNQIDLPVDGLINTLASQIGLTQYWSRTPLVEQGSMYGLFESQLDEKRKKRSKLNNILRYKLVVFKRRVLYKWYYRLKSTFFKYPIL